MEQQRQKKEEDPEDIYEVPKNNRFKTQLTNELDVILQEKLKLNKSKFDFRIKEKTKSRPSRRLFTELAL